MHRRPLTLAASLAATLALAACGEREEPVDATALGKTPTQALEVMLDFRPSPEHAGLYAAQAGGTFDAARLAVELSEPPQPGAALRALRSGEVDIAISYEPELLLARERGAELVSIGALVQAPLTSVVSSGEDAVGRTGRLRGQRVATAGLAYQEALLRAIFRDKGLRPDEVRVVDVGFDILKATVSDRFAAVFGATWNDEAVELELADRRPAALRIEQLGVPTYAELVFVVRARDARERGPLLRRFMQAVAAGHRRLREDPEEGTRALLRANDELNARATRASVRTTLPLFFPEPKEDPEGRRKPFGFQELGQWEALGRWMAANGALRRPPDVRGALTNEYLPGEGIAVGEDAP